MGQSDDYRLGFNTGKATAQAEIERLQKSNRWLAEKLGDEALMAGKLRAALKRIIAMDESTDFPLSYLQDEARKALGSNEQ